MSHSRGPPLLLLPLDLVSWLQVLIRAGGTEGCRRDVGKKGRRKKKLIDSSVGLVRCHAALTSLSVLI